MKESIAFKRQKEAKEMRERKREAKGEKERMHARIRSAVYCTRE